MGLAKSKRLKRLFTVFFFLFLSLAGFGQRYLTDLDSSFFIKDTLRPFLKRFDNIRITGYMQPQFQVAQADGAQTFEGGNFAQFSRSRFMLRRARVKIDYLLTSKEKFPKALFTFQIDATERGVIVRDMFIRLYETKKNNLAMTAGFFARPFGFEINLGSSYRESPERGRMSQTLMPGERDIGVMFSFEPQAKKSKYYHFKFDAGFFNGQGASGTTDFDSHKDFISRFTMKPYTINKIEIGAGISLLLGGWKNGTKYVYTSSNAANGDEIFKVDSSVSNLGRSSPRHYYGADVQVKLKHKWGETEWRAEYWFGTQPGTANSTSNPGTLPNSNGTLLPTYVRHYSGAFFYFLQNIINTKNQLIVKYDWYDPNIKVKKLDIGKAGTNLTTADIKYSTLGIGYVYHFNLQTKIIFYYDIVTNELTNLSGATTDQKDNIFTCRLQFRF
jgi:hypothetical protein